MVEGNPRSLPRAHQHKRSSSIGGKAAVSWKTLASRYSMAVERCIKESCSNSGWQLQGVPKLIQRATLRLVQRRHLGRQPAIQMIQQQWTRTAGPDKRCAWEWHRGQAECIEAKGAHTTHLQQYQ